MLNRMVTENLRSTLVIASTVAALLTGTGMAAAQVRDDPPGSRFQDQGNREERGAPAIPSPWSRHAGRSGGAYAYAPGRDYRIMRHYY